MWRKRSGVHERLAERCGELVDVTEVGVVAERLLGEQRVHRVMEVVAPLAVEAVAILLDGADELRIVEITLTDHNDAPPQRVGLGMYRFRDLLQEMLRAEVEDAVHGVEPQPVDVILRDPVERVVHDITTHLVAVGVVVIQSRSPRSLVLLGEVRSVEWEIVPLGAHVVVDDIENDREADRVRRVDELLQPFRSAVAVLHRVQLDPVVAPVARAGKLRDGHDLDRGDSELVPQTAQIGNRRREGAFGRERADVQLVDDELAHPETAPPVITPRECLRIDDARRTMDAVRLEPAHRIGHEPVIVVEYESVLSTRRRAAHRRLEDAMLATRELVLAFSFTREAHPYARRARRPHGEPNSRAGNHRCATLQLPQIRHWNCDVSNKWTCKGSP